MSSLPLSSEPIAERPPSSRLPPGPAPTDSSASDKSSLRRAGILLLLALAIGCAYLFNPPPVQVAQSGVVMDLPVFVGDYFGKQGEITPIELTLLPKDTEFARRFYDDSHGHEINCSIVLSGAEQRSIHRPEACLVGQGWTIVGQEDVPMQLQSGHSLVVRNLTVERQVVTQDNQHVTVRGLYVYWFVGDKITTPSHFTRILLSNWDRVINNRAHRWAYVSMFSIVTDNLRPDGLSTDATKAMIVDFIKQIVPTFQKTEMPPAS
jgi:hypothetical protein